MHHALIKNGLRTKVNIIVESGTVRDSHHCAALIGYGATAIYPYLAYESLNNMMKTNHILVAESIDENIIMAELLNE